MRIFHLNSHLILCLLSSLFLVNCESTSMQASDEGLPRVEVEGAIIDEVITAMDNVMFANGYRRTVQRFPVFVFEKEGSRMDDFAYGNMLEPDVWERVIIRIRDLGPDAHEIECEPLLVSDKDSIFEESKRISRFRRGKYTELMEQIRDQS